MSNKNFNEDGTIKKGHDRDVDYEPIKDKLINKYKEELKHYCEKRYNKRAGTSLIYLLIEMIQLRNGSRISEAIDAFRKFLNVGFNQIIMVKIGKSDSIKYVYDKYDKTKGKKKIRTAARYRKMMFPESWIDVTNMDEIFSKLKSSHDKVINNKYLRLNIVTFMERHFECNTHSLRYALINYLIYVQKRPINDVAKFVGHKDIQQLITYTQQKNCDQIFDLDI